jgi:diguanylate cyclase (GGDEF)-like protein/PAS domain S-box-containing protein
MDTESEPYVRLATLRQLHQVVAELNTARSLADTLQAVADGIVGGLGYELSAVNLVRPDGDLIVAAVGGSSGAEKLMAGRVGSRTSWERRLAMGHSWGSLRFIPHDEAGVLDGDDVPTWPREGPLPDTPDGWHPDDVPTWPREGPLPDTPDGWHPDDVLLAPMFATPAGDGELIGVISVGRPRSGRRPGAWAREALQMYSFQAAIAISNARLRANMQRALVRLEREQQALRASEESFRQAFEYAPSGMAIAEMGGGEHGRLLRANDALCRMLDRPAAAMRRYAFSDLVHPEDIGLLLRTAAEGGRAELRLARRNGSYLWVSLRNSVVADTADGPRFLLTHLEDIEERKRYELALAHRASHDSLTGLPNSAELRARLGARLCSQPTALVGHDVAAGDAEYAKGAEALELGYSPPTSPGTPYNRHVHAIDPNDRPDGEGGGKGLAVVFCDLDGFKSINDGFGHHAGDAVLIEVAQRLTGAVRDGDTVARLGGDEFVVLADGLDLDGAQELTVRLRNAISPPIRVDGRSVRVGASFGIGWAGCGMTVEEVLHSADQRMYVEKRSRSKVNRRAG